MGSLPLFCLRVPIPTAMGKQEPHTCGFPRRPSHPHQGGEIRVVVLMVAPAWRGFGGCSRTTPNPRNRTGGTRFGSPQS